MQIELAQTPIEHVNFRLSRQNAESSKPNVTWEGSKANWASPTANSRQLMTAQVWVEQVKYDLSKPRCKLSRPLHQLNVPTSDWARRTKCKVVQAVFKLHKPKCELGRPQHTLSRPDTYCTIQTPTEDVNVTQASATSSSSNMQTRQTTAQWTSTIPAERANLVN